MYEAVKVGERAYYMDCPTRVGIYDMGGGKGCLFDGGSDPSAGKKLLACLDSLGLKLEAVYNTHFHADHIGGNRLLQKRTGCNIYCPGGLGFAFVEYPELQSEFMTGAFPFAEYRDHKFYRAEQCEPTVLTEDVLPEGISIRRFEGHTKSMVAYKTYDGVWFLGDVISGEEILVKHGICYQYDIAEHLRELDELATLDGKMFVPSHADPTDDLTYLIKLNKDKMYENMDVIKNICKAPTHFDDIMAAVFRHYDIPMNMFQYVLVSCTVRSYLSYMHDLGEISLETDDSRHLYYKSV